MVVGPSEKGSSSKDGGAEDDDDEDERGSVEEGLGRLDVDRVACPIVKTFTITER